MARHLAPAILAKVPRSNNSCAALRAAPSATRVSPAPTLIRDTPNTASSGTVGMCSPARMLTGPFVARAKLPIVAASLASIGKTQSAPAFRYAFPPARSP